MEAPKASLTLRLELLFPVYFVGQIVHKAGQTQRMEKEFVKSLKE